MLAAADGLVRFDMVLKKILISCVAALALGAYPGLVLAQSQATNTGKGGAAGVSALSEKDDRLRDALVATGVGFAAAIAIVIALSATSSDNNTTATPATNVPAQ